MEKKNQPLEKPTNTGFPLRNTTTGFPFNGRRRQRTSHLPRRAPPRPPPASPGRCPRPRSGGRGPAAPPETGRSGAGGGAGERERGGRARLEPSFKPFDLNKAQFGLPPRPSGGHEVRVGQPSIVFKHEKPSLPQWLQKCCSSIPFWRCPKKGVPRGLVNLKGSKRTWSWGSDLTAQPLVSCPVKTHGQMVGLPEIGWEVAQKFGESAEHS